eukprot:2082788-Pyramimonas_sp.AAC.1
MELVRALITRVRGDRASCFMRSAHVSCRECSSGACIGPGCTFEGWCQVAPRCAVSRRACC